jgi:PKD repeat protein
MNLLYKFLGVTAFIFHAFYSVSIGQTITNIAALEQIAEERTALFEQLRSDALVYADENQIQVREEIDDRVIEIIYIDEFGLPQFYTTNNLTTAQSIATKHVKSGGSLGLNLDGKGIIFREWDGGAIDNKSPEMIGRVFPMDDLNSKSPHATHVAGTMIGSGAQPLAEGMANKALLYGYNWLNDDAEMALEAAQGAIISNHSYGFMRGWANNRGWVGNPSISDQEDYLFGFYDDNSRTWDEIAYYAPYYLIVKAAGNDRGEGSTIEDPPYPPDGPYDCISQKGVAKNILTVGAVNDLPNGYSDPSGVEMSSFSSWGPADDGRIKPDLVANGVEVFSNAGFLFSGPYYPFYSGTSMATPSVSGSLGLLQQHYQNLNGQDNIMRAATLKALAIHTADEAGSFPGPDYAYGWGLMNTTRAALKISEDQLLDVIGEHTLQNGEEFSRTVFVSGNEPLKVTVVWTDVPGTPTDPQLDPIDPMLVNDLNLVIKKGSSSWYPWKLDRNNPGSPATNNSANNVDNVEVVDVENPSPGEYSIFVSHDGSLVNDSQAFSMIISGISENNPPVANFYFQNENPGSLDNVPFRDASLGEPTSWSWTITPDFFNFTSGTGQNSKNPVVQFDEPGTYNVTLTVTNAYGSDQITKQVTVESADCPYCNSDYNNQAGASMNFNNVLFNSISNPRYAIPNGESYRDFTYMSTIVIKGTDVNLSLKALISSGSQTGHCFAWFDWNQDCDFNDPGEEYDLGQYDINNSDVSQNIAIPIGIPTGKTRMRIAIRDGLDPTPCLISSGAGKVEDYTIFVYDPDYPGTWTGLSSSEWGRGSNWSDGNVPDVNTDVIIPTDAPRFPALDRGLSINATSFSGFSCKSLVLQEGTQLSGYPYNSISVYGNLTLQAGSRLVNPQTLVVYNGGTLSLNNASIKPDYLPGKSNLSAGFTANSGSVVNVTNSELVFGSSFGVFEDVDWNKTGATPLTLHYESDFSSSIDIRSNLVYFDDFTVKKGTEAVYRSTATKVFEVDKMILEPGGMFTLEYGSNMLIYSQLILKDDKSNPAGSFINQDVFEIEEPEVIAEQSIEDNRWNFISSPVSDAQSDALTGMYLKSWDETTYTWNFITETNVPLNPGKGYEVWSTLGNPTIVYQGTQITDSDLALSLTVTDRNNDLAIGNGEGWNLVGNPFTSAIDWGTDNSPVSGYNRSDLDATIYFWNGVQYASFNPAGDGAGVNGGTQYIPSMQSFFIKANDFNPSLTLPANARIHSPESNYKSSSPFPSIRLVAKNSSFSDETLIRFIPESSFEFDGNFDGYKLDGIPEAPQIFTIQDNERFSINTMPSISEDLIVPMGLASGIPGSITLELQEIVNLEHQKLFLEDLKTGLFYDLDHGFQQTVNIDPQDHPVRFKIHFKDVNLEVQENNLNPFQIYTFQNHLYVRSSDDRPFQITVFDLSGRYVYKKSFSDRGIKKIELKLSPGHYIVKAYNEKQIRTSKIFLR